ncbi:MAG: mechanosensitive ion channel [Acidimicrobiia bacterium]|nr:mechanosensitive ion channel [Acidimicrobiia bacterium]
MTQERITAAAIAIGVAFLIWLIGKIIKGRVNDKWKELVGQLMPVLVFAVLVFGALTVIDPDQASALFDSLPGAVVSITVAVFVVVIAQALGKIAGLLVETAMRRVSPALASRGRLIVSSMILGVGVVIALQQVGISTDIILILVASLAFGFALTMALSVGLGSVPIARHVAAGRHVHNRYRPGDRIRVGDIDGTIAEIGLSTTRIEVTEGRSVDIPNGEFIAGVVDVRTAG